MKVHIAFVLLAIFAAAQAGKKNELMTFGSGYTHLNEEPGDYSFDNNGGGGNMGENAAETMDKATKYGEEAIDTLGTRSEAYSNIAQLFAELHREKADAHQEYIKNARNLAVHANDAYKKAQVSKREAKDKQTIAKEYEERAQKRDREAKDQDIMEQDAIRKEYLEMREWGNSIERSNTALVYAQHYEEMYQLETSETNECEQYVRGMQSRAEEFERVAKTMIENAKKEKENARIQQSKGKEDEAKANELDNAYIEASKKVHELKHYQLLFGMKAVTERHQAQYARIRSRYLALLANYDKEYAQHVYMFANMEYKDAQTFRKQALENAKQTRVLTAMAAHLMKSHRYTGHQMYSKYPFPTANFHGE